MARFRRCALPSLAHVPTLGLLAGSAALAALACARIDTPSLARPASSATPMAPSRAPSPEPALGVSDALAPPPIPTVPASPALSGEPVVALEVAGFRAAVLAVPIGSTRARPVVVALHGNFDRPEWQCEVWRAIVAARGFVLCPRGTPRRDVPASWDRWEYRSSKAVRDEIEAGLSALRARYANFVAEGPLVLIGFSLGAIYGAPLVLAEPARFPRVAFIEGGLSAWSSRAAQKFRANGGERLILACGQPDCLLKVKALGPELTRAGLPTEVGGTAKAGHAYDGDVARVLAERWDWFVAGDARWFD